MGTLRSLASLFAVAGLAILVLLPAPAASAQAEDAPARGLVGPK